MRRTHTKMAPTEAWRLAEELLSSRAHDPLPCRHGSPTRRRARLLEMNSKQILNNQPNKAVKPFWNEINKQYIIIIMCVTLHSRLSTIFI